MRGRKRYILADIVLWCCIGLLAGFLMGVLATRGF